MDSAVETMSPAFYKRWVLRILLAGILGFAMLDLVTNHLDFKSLWHPPIEEIGGIPYGYTVKSPKEHYTKDSVPLAYSFLSISGKTNLTGKRFNIDNQFWNRHRFLFDDVVKVTRDAMHSFVVAIAASSNHFKQSIDAVYSVQKFFPGKKILFFDWGLTPNESAAISTWCNVEIRAFDFSAIRSLSQSSISEPWQYHVAKPFAIAEALRDYPIVLWLDSTSRLLTPKLDYIFELAESNGGIVLLDKSTQGATRIPKPLYKFLPTNKELAEKRKHVTTGAIFVMRTREVGESVLWWWLLCSNTKECFFDQTIKAHCEVGSDPRKSRRIEANCSRVDHSIANVLTGNLYRHEWDKYCIESGLGTLFKISKNSHYKVQVC
jgi:hypothetical protein